MTARAVTFAAVALTVALLSGGPAATAATTSTVPTAAAPAEDSCHAGTRITEPAPAFASLQAELAWTMSRGAGMLVAVVDSGVNIDNPHLSGAVVGGIDLVGDGLGAGGLADTTGHGTAIAGQIAARSIEGSSVIGLAPEASILSVRVYADTEERTAQDGFGPTPERLAAGIRYAADQGAKIINVSLSTAQEFPVLRDAVAYATNLGSLVVASAGNADKSASFGATEGSEGRFPAGSPGALGVAASDIDGNISAASVMGPHVGISAPGQFIVTSSAAGGDCIYASEDPATSFSTAYVSAAAALVAAVHPNETPAQWAYRLQASAVRADPDNRNDAAGWGTVQPYDAIVLIPGGDVRGPLNAFTTSTVTLAEQQHGPALEVTLKESADAAALTLVARVGIIGVTIIATLAAIGLLVRRRSVRKSAAPAARREDAGLYGKLPG